MNEKLKIRKETSIKMILRKSPILGSLPRHCAEHNHLRRGKVVQIVNVHLDIISVTLSEHTVCSGMRNASHTKNAKNSGHIVLIDAIRPNLS